MVFFPAGGVRNFADGAVTYRGISGVYWSNSSFSTGYGWRVHFYYQRVNIEDIQRSSGISVRCVAQED